MVVIPFKDLPSFTQEIALSGVSYIFEFNWNYRGQYWSMSIYNRDRVPIVLGVKLVIFYELISKFVDRGLPRGGELYIIDPGGLMVRLDQGDFLSERVYLIYFEDGELVPV